jgi:hypothetical protein
LQFPKSIETTVPQTSLAGDQRFELQGVADRLGWVAVSTLADTRTPSERAMFSMPGVFAGFDRSMRRDRIIAISNARPNGLADRLS